MSQHALQKAIDAVGGQSALARLLTNSERKVSQGHVWAWLNRDQKVPAEYVLAIEAASGGAVSRYELRRDVFGPDPAAPEEETERAA